MFRKYLEKIVKSIIKDNEASVKKNCQQLVYELFSQKETKETTYSWEGTYHRNTLKGELIDLIKDNAWQETNRYIDCYETEKERENKKLIKDIINGEGFIDKIVERIIKKQLCS